MSPSSEGKIKKRVGRPRAETPGERLDQLWRLYLYWKSTPAGRLMYAKLFEKLLSGNVEFLLSRRCRLSE